MKIDPNAPAYPFCFKTPNPDGSYGTVSTPGIPIRLSIAAQIMAGWAANERHKGHYLPKDDAAYCLHMADSLIAAYNEGE